VLTCALTTIGLAAVGTAYGALSAGLRVRDTLLPLLYFPVVAPLILAAVKATQAALGGTVGEAWPWVRLLAVFATIFVAVGVLTFGTLLEES
jgi:ABC-type transport system involved in cytochrome c biogenesis permease component